MRTDGNGITIKEALETGIRILKENNNETPAFETGVMLCNVLKCDKAFLYSHNDTVITGESADIYFKSVEKRISGIPLQYITGYQEFMSLKFQVSSEVLIPRQDTEVLVEAVINHSAESLKGKRTASLSVLDVGTGSGCIAISLAYYIKNSIVTAVDISRGALDIARINAENAGVANRIYFKESNLFGSLTGSRENHGFFDIIVSNPPYIASDEIESLQVEVKCHEPRKALDGGCDGLDFYRAIIGESSQFLSHRGLLAFEVGYDQSQIVAGLMEKKFYSITIIKDLSNVERVVTGCLKDI